MGGCGWYSHAIHPLPPVLCPNPGTRDGVTSHGKRDLAGLIQLRMLRLEMVPD